MPAGAHRKERRGRSWAMLPAGPAPTARQPTVGRLNPFSSLLGGRICCGAAAGLGFQKPTAAWREGQTRVLTAAARSHCSVGSRPSRGPPASPAVFSSNSAQIAVVGEAEALVVAQITLLKRERDEALDVGKFGSQRGPAAHLRLRLLLRLHHSSLCSASGPWFACLHAARQCSVRNKRLFDRLESLNVYRRATAQAATLRTAAERSSAAEGQERQVWSVAWRGGYPRKLMRRVLNSTLSGACVLS